MNRLSLATLFLIASGMALAPMTARAEGGCPSGYYPISDRHCRSANSVMYSGCIFYNDGSSKIVQVYRKDIICSQWTNSVINMPPKSLKYKEVPKLDEAKLERLIKKRMQESQQQQQLPPYNADRAPSNPPSELRIENPLRPSNSTGWNLN